MAIRQWHAGKLIILWAWGGIAVALALTGFLSSPVKDAPVAHLVELLFVLLALLALSGVTWHWLGGREPDGK
jgi:predicted membrane protein